MDINACQVTVMKDRSGCQAKVMTEWFGCRQPTHCIVVAMCGLEHNAETIFLL